MIHILKETTGRVGDFRYPENIYFVDKKAGKLHAMIDESGKKTVFSQPFKFDTRRRTFQTLGQKTDLYFVLPSACKE